MSLARTLLNNSASDVDTSMYQFTCEASDIDDSMYLDSACESLVIDIYNVDKAFHVADIMGEVKVIKEGADATVLLEGMISNAKEKLVDAFKKFIAKIKAWFDAVVRYFKSFFLQGKKFADEFGSAIRDKYNGDNGKKFTYRGFKYTLSAGDSLVDHIIDTGKKNITDAAGQISDKTKNDDAAKAIVDQYTEKKKKLSDDTSDISGKKISTSELSDLIKKTYRSDATEKDDNVEISFTGVDEMLTMISGKGSNVQNDAKKIMNDLSNATNVTINNIKRLGEPAKGDNDNVYKLAQALSKYITDVLNLCTTASNVKIDAYKEACTTYRSVLGSFYRWKPAKEDTEINIDTDDEGETDDSTEECKESTIFEAAWNLL